MFGFNKVKPHDQDPQYNYLCKMAKEQFKDDPVKQLEYIKDNGNAIHYSLALADFGYMALKGNKNPFDNLKYSYDEVKTLFAGIFDAIRYSQSKLPENIYYRIVNEIEPFINNTMGQAFKTEDESNSSKEMFDTLDRMLYCTLGREILLPLTSDEIGLEDKRYILKDYSLSFPRKSLTFVVERKEDEYKLTLWPVKLIDYTVNGNRIKTWTEIEGKTWRYYLFMDFDKYKSQGTDFKSEKYEEKDEYKEIEKLKYTDPLRFHIEHTKHFFARGSTDTEKFIKTKSGDDVCLLNAFYEKIAFGNSQNGTVYLIDKTGKFGLIHYEIKHPCQEGKPIKLEIVDIQPNGRENEGIGTPAYNMIEEFAKSQGATEVFGDLSDRDLDEHKERTLHFYSKLGFEIKGYKIKKQL